MIALWRGWLPSVIGVIPYVGLNFSVYETLKDVVLKHYGESVQAVHSLVQSQHHIFLLLLSEANIEFNESACIHETSDVSQRMCHNMEVLEASLHLHGVSHMAASQSSFQVATD
jgi:hypothetical protein